MPRDMKVKSEGNGNSNNNTETNVGGGEGKRRVRGDVWQMWHRNGTRCPKGTVPVRRSTVHDVLRAKSLYDYGKKQRTQIPVARRSNAPEPDILSAGNGHEVHIWFLTIILLILLHVMHLHCVLHYQQIMNDNV